MLRPGSTHNSAAASNTGSTGATRDKFDIYCTDTKQVLTYYASLPDAWAAAKTTPCGSCYTKEKSGENTVVLTDDDKNAIAAAGQSVTANDQTARYGYLVGICAEWNDSKTDMAFNGTDQREAFSASRMVCPDSPFAASMQAHLSAPIVTPRPTPLATPAPTPTHTPTDTPTPAPTTTVTYRIETDGTIGVITYDNYVHGQNGL